MSEEVFVLKMFSNEIEARMVQEMLQKSGVEAFVFKDDVGGMEPQLQLTAGVRLLVSGVDAERAHLLLENLTPH